MTTPTPAEFMATAQPDEDDDTEPLGLSHSPGVTSDPIAAALERIAVALESPDQTVELRQNFAEAEADLHEQLRAQGEELAAVRTELEETVTTVLEIVKKSTSKLAHEVRAALQGAQAQPAESKAVQCPACERYFTDRELLTAHACTADPEAGKGALVVRAIEPPAHDAPIEDWVAFAQARGLDIDPGKTNRSQIRSLLGIPHPSAGQGGES